jgi:hypothetical protein
MTESITTPRHVFLVLEFEVHTRGVSEGVTVSESHAGTDSVITRVWPALHGVISASQLQDLLASISNSVTTAIVTFAHVQQDLPLS